MWEVHEYVEVSEECGYSVLLLQMLRYYDAIVSFFNGSSHFKSDIGELVPKMYHISIDWYTLDDHTKNVS